MSEISDVLLELTGERPYQRIDSELRYRCFFCNNPKRKFYISTKTGQWVCFNEGIKGNLNELIGKLTGKSNGEVKRWLKSHQFDNPMIVEAEQKAPNDLFSQLSILQNDSVIKLPNLDDLKMPNPPTNCKYLMNHFHDSEAIPYFQYCHKRGLTLADIEISHVSYVQHGVFRRTDGGLGHLSNSLVFFTYYHNRPIYWNTRNIYNGVPKSLNASAKPGEFSRKEAVFNLNNYKPFQNIMIAEGVFNAITLNDYSSDLGIATFGKNVSNMQVAEIAHTINPKRKIYICLDSDAFNLASKLRNNLMNYGVSSSQIYIVDDRELKSYDWNDIGHVNSIKLIREKAYRPTFFSKLSKIIK